MEISLGNIDDASRLQATIYSIIGKLALECDFFKFGTIFVFANAFISVTYVLNGRKVTAKLLKRLEKMKI